jgi:uncharacterized membrane protein
MIANYGLGRFKLSLAFFAAHVGALIFGMIGIMYMIPNVSQFAGNERAMSVYTWSMDNAGATHILLGAITMFVFGVQAIGWRKTSIFFVVTYVISLSSELIGTGTGWPFGNYEYTDYLGWMVSGRVPYTIPLSWFYVGFAVYLIGEIVSQNQGWRRGAVWSVAIGAYLLTVWDLVLDPAMAHESMVIKFWLWETHDGAYFGMPIKNFIGWTATGILYMGISRALWRERAPIDRLPGIFPFAVFAVNTVFAMGLSLSVGLWIPCVLAIALGIVPAAMALIHHGNPDLEVARAEAKRVRYLQHPSASRPVA